MWNLKYDSNELIYKTETDSQTQRTDLWLPRGRGREGWTGRLGLADANVLYVGGINKALPQSTRNYAGSISCDWGGSAPCGSAVRNPTSIHEHVDSSPGIP